MRINVFLLHMNIFFQIGNKWTIIYASTSLFFSPQFDRICMYCSLYQTTFIEWKKWKIITQPWQAHTFCQFVLIDSQEAESHQSTASKTSAHLCVTFMDLLETVNFYWIPKSLVHMSRSRVHHRYTGIFLFWCCYLFIYFCLFVCEKHCQG